MTRVIRSNGSIAEQAEAELARAKVARMAAQLDYMAMMTDIDLDDDTPENPTDDTIKEA